MSEDARPSPDVEHHTVHVRDIDMHYVNAGSGDPVLLLHGLGSSAQDWERQIPVLAERFRVIAVDLRGHGRTDKPPGPYSIRAFADDVVAFLDALGLDAVHVVGLSMGGMTAFQMAVDTPARVRSLVIVNSAPEMVARTLGERLLIRQRLFIARILGMKRLGKFLAGKLFPEPHQGTERKLLETRWAENDPQAYLASFRAIVGWSVADRIDGIACPTLVVTADQDYTPVATKRAYTDRIPGARLEVIEHSRHATPLDQTERFNDVVVEFLTRV